ncbi:MAG: GNAT family N-acetyltransferase [Candidatus Woesearchaeota archaeon]
MFRKIKRGEHKEVAKLLNKSWKSRRYKDAEKYIAKGHSIEIIDDQFFVFENYKGDIVGIIGVVLYYGGVAELRDLVIDGKYRGLGYSTQMLERAIGYCSSNKIRKVYGYVRYQDEGLLKSLGFHVEGVLKNHFVDGEDLLILSKFLFP